MLSFTYFEYADSLFRYGQKFTANDQIVEDCIHDLFVNMTFKEHLLVKTVDIRLYVFRSFRNNLFRMLSRAMKIERIPHDKIFEAQYRIEKVESVENDNHGLVEKLQDTIKELSSRRGEAIYLRFMNGLSMTKLHEQWGQKLNLVEILSIIR